MRRLALGVQPGRESTGERFHYNNYHPLLLGMILERATGQQVAHYLQEKIWKPLGMEYAASRSLDSTRSGFEKMESGINARSIDYGRFGRLYLNKGNWNGVRVISDEWIVESAFPGQYSWSIDYWLGEGAYYNYMWYSIPRNDGFDILALGHLGQVIYVSPEKNAVVVRTGYDDNISPWVVFISGVVDRLPPYVVMQPEN